MGLSDTKKRKHTYGSAWLTRDRDIQAGIKKGNSFGGTSSRFGRESGIPLSEEVLQAC